MKTTVKKTPAINGRGNPVQPGRAGRVLIGSHFMPSVQRELKILAASEGITLNQLLREALTLLFVNRGLPTVDKLEASK